MEDKNYFEIFDLEPSFTLDLGKVKKTFYRLSRDLHPDFHTQETEEVQAQILLASTQLNDAYKILKDEEKRIKYILDLHSILGDEGQNKLPQEFLMEMMDINEAIIDLQFDYSVETLENTRSEVGLLEARLKADVQSHMDAFDKSGEKSHLEKVKDYYLRHKYLVRIKENLDTFATGKVRM